MPDLRPTLALLAALLTLGAEPLAAQRAPRFALTADTVLFDEQVGIALAGLTPGSTVKEHLGGLGSVAYCHSAASFRADNRGRVDLTRATPVSGDYVGVTAVGLFWSARPDSGLAPPRSPHYGGQRPTSRRPSGYNRDRGPAVVGSLWVNKRY